MFSSYRSVSSAFTGRECISYSLPTVRGGRGAKAGFIPAVTKHRYLTTPRSAGEVGVPRGRTSVLPRACLHQADDVALRVGEESDRGLGRDLRERHQDPAAQLLDLGERGLGVFGVDVERDPAGRALRRVANAAGDRVFAAAHHPVPARVVGVERPTEGVGVELLQRLPVLARDLEMNYVATHERNLLCVFLLLTGRRTGGAEIDSLG